METGDHGTQQLTCPQERPVERNSSHMSESDLRNIILVLLPSSSTASAAVQGLITHSPQHILQYEQIRNDWEESSVDIGDGDDTQAQQSTANHLLTPRLGPVRSKKLGHLDVAWRFDSSLKEPSRGLVFGRNPDFCDVVLGDADSIRRVSNVHFRIYLNDCGIPMLEDCSTNGTYIDGNVLRADKGIKTWMLKTGQVISMIQGTENDEEELKFVVKFPERGMFHGAYEQRLDRYLHYLQVSPELLKEPGPTQEVRSYSWSFRPPN